MRNKHKLTFKFLVVFGLFLFLVISARNWSLATETGTSKVVFYVG